MCSLRSTYSKIGTVQRRSAWPLHKGDMHIHEAFHILGGLICSSAGKEPACNAGDPGSIPGLGRSAGEALGCPLPYSRASLVAQLVKNPPAMRETPVQSPGWEDLLEKGEATTPVFWLGESHGLNIFGVARSQTGLGDFHCHGQLTALW